MRYPAQPKLNPSKTTTYVYFNSLIAYYLEIALNDIQADVHHLSPSEALRSRDSSSLCKLNNKRIQSHLFWLPLAHLALRLNIYSSLSQNTYLYLYTITLEIK